MSATHTIACGICERPIANAPPDRDAKAARSGATCRDGPVLCPACAAHPELVRAWREGLARKAERPA